MSGESTGQGAYIKFGSTVMSTNYRSFDTSEEVEMVDATSGAATRKNWLAVVGDGTGEFSGIYAGTAPYAAVAPGTSGTLVWGEEGTADGKPKHTCTATVKKRARKIPYNNVIDLSVTFQFTSDVTDGTWSSGA